MTTSTTTRTVLRLSMVAGALAAVTAASVHPAQAATATTAAAPSATTSGTTAAAVSARLAGADRYATAAAVSRHQFPAGATSVYLVNGFAAADAISAGMVGDGPILLVPGSGPVPASVTAEIRRLAPKRVVAIGGTGVISSSTLGAAAQGRSTQRLAGADRYSTAAAVARASYRVEGPSGDHMTMFVNSTPTVDGIVAGSLASPSTPVLPVPATGPAPAVIRSAAAYVNGGYAAAVGGPSVVSDATLRSAAGGQVLGRLAGADRYATSVAVAGAGLQAPKVVYLASGSGPDFADALAGGSLTRGPIVLVPKSGAIPQSVAAYLAKVRPGSVVALGGTGAISDAMLRTAQNAASGRMPTVDVRIPNPYTAKDRLRAGWTVVKKAAASGELTCDAPSIAGAGPNTYWCGGTYQRADACLPKPGYPMQVTCVLDPIRRTLLEYTLEKALQPTEAPEATGRLPLGVELTSGTTCRLRSGGAWSERDGLVAWAGCGTQDDRALWAPSDGDPSSAGRVDGATWQYRLGSFDTTTPVQWQDAVRRYFIG